MLFKYSTDTGDNKVNLCTPSSKIYNELISILFFLFMHNLPKGQLSSVNIMKIYSMYFRPELFILPMETYNRSQ